MQLVLLTDLSVYSHFAFSFAVVDFSQRGHFVRLKSDAGHHKYPSNNVHKTNSS